MMEARLARYFVRLQRRRAAGDAVHDAIASGILRVRDETSLGAGAGARSFAVGGLVAGKSAEEALRAIRRSSASGRVRRSDDHDAFLRTTSVKLRADANAIGGATDGQAEYRALWLVNAVRASAMSLRAGDVATVLLIAHAAGKSGLASGEIAQALAMPAPLVSVAADAEGFEETLLELLAGGAIVPGGVSICEGSELARKGSMRFARARDPRWHAVAFKASELDDDGSEWREQQVGFAAASGYPVIGVSEHGRVIPEMLKHAAALHLECGPLTPEIVMKTMLVVLGACDDDHLVPEHVAALSLADLAIAIRSGQSPARASELLSELGRRRFMARQDQERAGGVGRSSRGANWSKGKSNRQPSSGADVIQPIAPPRAPKDQFILRVETLAGYGEAVDWALALKEDLAHWQKGELGWSEMSTKMLLSGPPGTGKTTFARALCNSLQVPLVATSVATWLEPGYLGDVLKRMAATFAEAEAAKPAILFVDELDGIGWRDQRGEWSHYWTSVVNRALELLDGAGKTSGVIVVGATNSPSVIDPALLRSGRLEKHIVIPPPDTEALIGILQHHLRDDLDAVVATVPAQTMTGVGAAAARPDLPTSGVTIGAHGLEHENPMPAEQEHHDDVRSI